VKWLTIVLGDVPKARLAEPGTPFNKTLGILLAPSEDMGVKKIATLALEPIESFVNTALTGMEVPANSQWTSLEALRTGELKERLCDYWLVTSLATPRVSWEPIGDDGRRAAMAWAAQVVHQAANAP